MSLLLNNERIYDVGDGYAFSPLSKFSGLMTYYYLLLHTNHKNRIFFEQVNTYEKMKLFDRKYNILNYVIKNENYLFMSNNSRPGIILAVIENEGIIISTKTDPIILLEAKLEGKNISSKKQLIQQLKPSAGEYLSD